MISQIAIKRLTASDLTLFEYHFRNTGGTNQKAINLNADVFVGVMFPELPAHAADVDGRFPLDLFLYGPGLAEEWNLQRKIVKHGTYKNWRLNGEFIADPDSDPDRFHRLQAGDLMVAEFYGVHYPTKARVVLIASELADDKSLHTSLTDFLDKKKMTPISSAELIEIVGATNPSSEHPIRELALDEDLEDAALGGMEGARRLSRRRSGRKISGADLRAARKRAEDIGRLGEELVNDLFLNHLEDSTLTAYFWSADENAVSPYDFTTTDSSGTVTRVEVKTTNGDFRRRFHISYAELVQMVDPDVDCHLYRLYNANSEGATLQICQETRSTAAAILETLDRLPNGVTADSVSVTPETFDFGPPISIAPRLGDEDEDED